MPSVFQTMHDLYTNIFAIGDDQSPFIAKAFLCTYVLDLFTSQLIKEPAYFSFLHHKFLPPYWWFWSVYKYIGIAALVKDKQEPSQTPILSSAATAVLWCLHRKNSKVCLYSLSALPHHACQTRCTLITLCPCYFIAANFIKLPTNFIFFSNSFISVMFLEFAIRFYKDNSSLILELLFLLIGDCNILAAPLH